MRVQETLMNRSFSVMNSDPYLLSLKAMENISRSGKVIEKKNKYETDGPHHRSFVNFDVVEIVDDFSKIVFNFDLVGENGTLRVTVTGSLITKVEDTGFFSHAFSDHYIKEIYPVLRKMSGEKIEFFGKRVDRIFQKSIPAS